MRWLRASHLLRVSASPAGVAPARQLPFANALPSMEDSMTARVGVVTEDFWKLTLGYGLTTAEILYRMPDHPSLLQTYVWQDYDLFPRFPALKDFLQFWQEKLEGPLFRVT